MAEISQELFFWTPAVCKARFLMDLALVWADISASSTQLCSSSQLGNLTKSWKSRPLSWRARCLPSKLVFPPPLQAATLPLSSSPPTPPTPGCSRGSGKGSTLVSSDNCGIVDTHSFWANVSGCMMRKWPFQCLKGVEKL